MKSPGDKDIPDRRLPGGGILKNKKPELKKSSTFKIPTRRTPSIRLSSNPNGCPSQRRGILRTCPINKRSKNLEETYHPMKKRKLVRRSGSRNCNEVCLKSFYQVDNERNQTYTSESQNRNDKNSTFHEQKTFSSYTLFPGFDTYRSRGWGPDQHLASESSIDRKRSKNDKRNASGKIQKVQKKKSNFFKSLFVRKHSIYDGPCPCHPNGDQRVFYSTIHNENPEQEPQPNQCPSLMRGNNQPTTPQNARDNQQFMMQIAWNNQQFSPESSWNNQQLSSQSSWDNQQIRPRSPQPPSCPPMPNYPCSRREAQPCSGYPPFQPQPKCHFQRSSRQKQDKRTFSQQPENFAQDRVLYRNEQQRYLPYYGEPSVPSYSQPLDWANPYVAPQTGDVHAEIKHCVTEDQNYDDPFTKVIFVKEKQQQLPCRCANFDCVPECFKKNLSPSGQRSPIVSIRGMRMERTSSYSPSPFVRDVACTVSLPCEKATSCSPLTCAPKSCNQVTTCTSTSFEKCIKTDKLKGVCLKRGCENLEISGNICQDLNDLCEQKISCLKSCTASSSSSVSESAKKSKKQKSILKKDKKSKKGSVKEGCSEEETSCSISSCVSQAEICSPTCPNTVGRAKTRASRCKNECGRKSRSKKRKSRSKTSSKGSKSSSRKASKRSKSSKDRRSNKEVRISRKRSRGGSSCAVHSSSTVRSYAGGKSKYITVPTRPCPSTQNFDQSPSCCSDFCSQSGDSCCSSRSKIFEGGEPSTIFAPTYQTQLSQPSYGQLSQQPQPTSSFVQQQQIQQQQQQPPVPTDKSKKKKAKKPKKGSKTQNPPTMANAPVPVEQIMPKAPTSEASSVIIAPVIDGKTQKKTKITKASKSVCKKTEPIVIIQPPSDCCEKDKVSPKVIFLKSKQCNTDQGTPCDILRAPPCGEWASTQPKSPLSCSVSTSCHNQTVPSCGILKKSCGEMTPYGRVKPKGSVRGCGCQVAFPSMSNQCFDDPPLAIGCDYYAAKRKRGIPKISGPYRCIYNSTCNPNPCGETCHGICSRYNRAKWNPKKIVEFVSLMALSAVLVTLVIYYLYHWAIHYRRGFRSIPVYEVNVMPRHWPSAKSGSDPVKKWLINWHFMYMVCGFYGFGGAGALVFRALRSSPRGVVEIIHFLLQSGAAYCVYKGYRHAHDYHRAQREPLDHFSYIHSMVGMLTVCTFAVQYVLGVLVNLILGLSAHTNTLRMRFKPIHCAIGYFLLFNATVNLLLGISNYGILVLATDSLLLEDYEQYYIDFIAILVCCTYLTLQIAMSRLYESVTLEHEWYVVPVGA